jgi:peptide deformylase
MPEGRAIMPVCEIVRLGHPALRTPSEAVPVRQIGSPELQGLVADLVDTLSVVPGVGLAAAQLGVPKQVFAFERPVAVPGEKPQIQVVINPLLEPHGGELVYEWEGCLSIPDLLGLVPRHLAVRLWGKDPAGEDLQFELIGFTARVVQHEYDHLHGVLFLDRMRDLRSLTYAEEWERFAGEEDRRTAVG